MSRFSGAHAPAVYVLATVLVPLVLLPLGCTGPSGKSGPTGGQGVPGESGVPGRAGAPGTPGARGGAGTVGPRGASGVQGQPGTDGAQGPAGDTGPAGAQGDPGASGPPGGAGPPGPGYVTLDADGLVGVVRDTAGDVVAGARIFLIPNEAVVVTPLPLAEFGADSEDDEPLEDLIRADLANPTFPRTETDFAGRYHFDTLPELPSFLVVWPADDDTAHLPGGKDSRTAIAPAELVGRQRDLEVSTVPPADAYYVGSAACTLCHGRLKQAGTLMANGLRHLHGNTGRQRLIEANFPAIATLRDAFAGGQAIFFAALPGGGYSATEADPGAGPGPGDARRVRFDLRADGDAYFVRVTNLVNAGDGASGREYAVEFTTGGGLNATNLVTRIGDSRQVLPMTFNHRGDDANTDPTAHVWADHGLDDWYDAAAERLIEPGNEASFDLNCAGCHFTGFSLTGDAATGYRAHGADTDATEGLFDYDDNGFADEMNIGCESCHGPGSAHWDVAGQGRFIVSPSLLTPERETLLCGRCHSGAEGKLGNSVPLDAAGNFPRPGIDRQTFLAEFTRVADAVPGVDAWTDSREHSKNGPQQATDFLRSGHARNQRHLMACSSCHNVHGTGDTTPYLLVARMDDDTICNRCHELEGANKTAHIVAATTFDHAPSVPTCVDCHMPMTARYGAGRPGLANGADQYKQGDIASHLFVVPRKVEIDGVPANEAMPLPYTNACGVCHQTFPPTGR